MLEKLAHCTLCRLIPCKLLTCRHTVSCIFWVDIMLHNPMQLLKILNLIICWKLWIWLEKANWSRPPLIGWIVMCYNWMLPRYTCTTAIIIRQDCHRRNGGGNWPLAVNMEHASGKKKDCRKIWHASLCCSFSCLKQQFICIVYTLPIIS